MRPIRHKLILLAAAMCFSHSTWAATAAAQTVAAPEDKELVSSLLGPDVNPIDLASALGLGGVRNPQLLLARERVLEAVALRQLAAAQFLPSLHTGTSFNNHNGNLQQSNGNMLKVDRGSFYIGAGAHAVGAGSVGIPGVFWSVSVSETIYKALSSRQMVQQRQFARRAVENDVLQRIAFTYMHLLRAEGRRVIAVQNLNEAREVARVTAVFAKAGQGRQADADRARTESLQREAFLREQEGEVLMASARLAELLNLPPSMRLHPVEDKTVPSGAVPDPIPLPELLAVAVLNRPELQEQQVAIRRAMLALDGAKVLPFSPTVIIGFSYGVEGARSSLGAEPLGVNERADVDAVAFWTLQNLGAGNLAMIKAAQSQLASTNLELVARMNRVRSEVASAYAKTHARFARIETCEQAVEGIQSAFVQDTAMIKGGVGRPIELLDSMRLLARARLAYLDAIMDYNLAQMELYVALGQPPANALARPVLDNLAAGAGQRTGK